MKSVIVSIVCVISTVTSTMGFQQPLVSPIQKSRMGGISKSSVLDELSSVGESTSSGMSTTELPPLLQDMVNERRNFEMNLGKAMDVLRKDYPYMLYKTPGEYRSAINIFQIISRILH